MRSSSWLRLFGRASPRSKKTNRQTYRKHKAAAPAVERLEDRTTPAAVLNSAYNALDHTMSGFRPPDTSGAVGPTNYVETVNQLLSIYTPKGTGTASVRDDFGHFWYTVGGLSQTDSNSFLSDPIVTYDNLMGRFIVGDQDVDFGSAHVSNFDIAVSKTSSPTTLTTADWNFYQINTTEATFDADYPGNFGYNADAFVFTLNMFGSSSAHVQVVSVNASDLANGVSQGSLRSFHNDVNDFALRPATMHDAIPGGPMWLVTDTGNGTQIDVYKMTNVLSNSATFADTRLSVNPYTNVGAGNAHYPRQPNGNPITTNTDSRFINAAVATNTLVATHAVALSTTQNVAQWYAIDVSGTPTMQQQGDVGLGNNRYSSYPGIDISPVGNIGMSFMDSGTGAGKFLSVYATGRLATDPAGTMSAPFLVKQGTTNLGDGRAGDLSGINVDPINGSFYAASEFSTGGSWNTEVVNFTVGATIISLDASNNMVVTDTVGQNDTLTLRADTTNNRYVITDPNHLLATSIGSATEIDPHTVWVPFAAVAGPRISVNTLGGNDTLTVDYSLGSFAVPGKQIVYDGGVGTNSLTIVGGAGFASDVYNATGAGAGNLSFNGFSNIAFSNVSSSVTVVPAAGSTTVGIGDGLSHTATITAGAGAGNDTVAFDGGLVRVTFPNPTAAFTVNGDPGSDTITVASLDAGFNAGLTVLGSTGGNDVVNLNTPLNLTGALTVDNAVDTTNLNANATATSVSVQSATTRLGTNATVDTSAANGSIAFAAIDDSAADTHTVTLTAGNGGVTLGAIGAALPVLGFTIGSAGAVSLQGVTTGVGGIGVAVAGAVGTTLHGDLSSASAITLTGNVSLGATVLLTHSGVNSLSISGGVVNTDGAASSAANALNDFAFTLATTGNIASTITGTGNLGATGPGTLTLLGTNDYSGTTAISAGTLRIDAGGTSGSLGAGAVTDDGSLVFDRGDTITVANTISGSGSLSQAGSGITILSGNKAYTGPTFVNGGTLQVNDALASNVTVNAGGTLTGGGTINGNVAGAGIVSPGVTGPGILTVNGNLTMSGRLEFDVNEPYLTAGIDFDQIIVSGTVDLSGAGLDFTGGSAAAFAPLFVTPIVNNSANPTITDGATAPADGTTFFLGSAGFTLHYNGGDGNDLVLDAVTLGPAVVYVDDNWAGFNPGDPIADADPVAPGNQPATFGTDAFSSVMTALANVGGNGTIIVNDGIYNEAVAVNRVVTMNLQQGPIRFGSLAGTVSTALVNLNGITLTTGGNNNTTLFKGSIAGTGGLTKTGTGTMTLANPANSYTGATTISGGALKVGTLADGGLNSNIGASSNAADNLVLDGGTLQYTGPAVSTDRLFSVGTAGGTLDGSGSGALTFTNGGALGFNGQVGARTLTLTGAANGNTLFPTLGDNGGASDLVNAGVGSWVLAGDNGYSGTTTISAGTLQVGNGGTSGTLGSGAVSDNAILAINRSDSVIVANAISGTGLLVQAGSGSTILTADNAYGATTINAGTLQVANGGTSGTLGGGPVTDNAALVFDRGDNITVANVITGTGSVIQAGAGMTTLAATNSYIGPTTITAGVLSVTLLADGGAGSNIGASTNVAVNLVLDGGTLQYIGPAVSTDRLFSVGTAGGTLDGSGSGALAFTNVGALGLPGTGARALTLTGTGSGNTLASTFGNNGGASELDMTGTGSWILAGANGYSGFTTLTAGTLQVGNGGTTGTLGSGAVTDNASLVFNRQDNLIVANTITGTGSFTQAGVGRVTLTGNNSYDTTIVNGGTLRIGNGGANGTLGTGAVADNGDLQFNRSDTLTVPNLISGIGNLTDIGSGTIILTGDDTVADATVFGGTLQLGDGGTSGALSLTGQVNDSGTLVFNRSDTVTVPYPITAVGAVIQAGTGTVILLGNNAYSLTTTIEAGTLQIGNGGITGTLGSGSVTANASLVFDRGDTIMVANTISGSGTLTQAGTGTVILTGGNTYTGTTAISAGTLQVDNGGTTGTLGSGDVTDSGALVFDRSDTITVGNAISGSGSVALVSTGTLILTGNNSYGATAISAGTLQVGNAGTSGTLGIGPVTDDASLVFNRTDTLLVPNAISGTGTLTQAGTGTTILAGNNSYGTTAISAGTLQVGNGGTSGALGSGGVTNNASLVFDRSDTLTVANVISGTGALAQAGTGTTILTGNNNYTGVTSITAGILSVGTLANGGANSNIGAASVLAANLVLDGGTLQYTGPTISINRLFSVGTAGGAIDGSGIGALTFTNIGALGFNGASGARLLTLTGTTSGNTLFPTLGDNGGASSLAQTGTGSWALTGGNSYSGTTTISAGTLQVGKGGTIGTLGSGDVSDNAALIFNRSDTLIAANNISGTGSLTQAGGGTLILTGTNSYGTTTIAAGTLRIGNAGTSGTLGGGAVTDNAALVFNRTDTLIVGNRIGGTGSLTQAGAGRTVLTANNSYAGPTTISAGTLQIGNGAGSGTLGGGPVTDNGAVIFNRGDAVTVANAISGVGAVTQAGAGTLTLTANNSYAGATKITGGVLSVGTLANGGANSNIGASGNVGTNLVLDGGTLQYTGPAITIDRLFSVGAAGATLDSSGSGALTFGNGGALALSGGTGARTLTLTGTAPGNTLFPILGDSTGASSLVKAGAGSWVLAGNHLYSGTTTISAGTLQLGTGGTSGTLGSGSVSDNGSLVFTHSDSPIVPNVISGVGTLTQAGTGSLTLTGADTYTGATTVNAGTLLVNAPGSLSASAVTVNSSATMGGTGTVNGTVTVNSGGALSPGGNPGILNIGNLILASGSTLRVDLNSPYLAAGTNYDQINVTGSVTLGGATLVLLGGGVPAAPGLELTLINNTGVAPIGGGFTGLSEGGAVGLGGFSGAVSYAGGVGGNDVTVTVSGPASINETGGGANFILRRDTNGTPAVADDRLQLLRNGLIVDARPLASVTSYAITGQDNSDDTLTIDYAFGGVFNVPVTFNGGAAGNDGLFLQGGAFSTATYTDANGDSGALQLDSIAVTYTGIEALANRAAAVNMVVNLPNANVQAALQDDSGGTGNGLVALASTNGTIVNTTFQTPSNALAVNSFPGTRNIISTTPAFGGDWSAGLTLNGASANDTDTINALTLSAGTGSLAVTATSISVNAPVVANVVTLNATTGPSGDVAVNAAVTGKNGVGLSASRDVGVADTVRTTVAGASIGVTGDSNNVGVGGVWLQAPSGALVANAQVVVRGSDLAATGATVDSVRVDGPAGVDRIIAGGDITIQSMLAAPGGASVYLDGGVRSLAAGTVSVSSHNALFLSSNIASSGGGIGLSQRAVLTGNVTVASGGGPIGFGSTIDADAAANNRTLSVSAGSGDVNVAGAIGGGQALLALAVPSVRNLTLGGVLTTSGDFVQTTGAALTTLNGASIGGKLAISADAITLNAAPVSASGNVSLVAQNAVTVNGGINAGAGTITLAANQDGAGTEGFTQDSAAVLQTTNATASAVGITVNAAGGVGNVRLGAIQTGVGGTVTINVNQGGTIDNNGSLNNVTATSLAMSATNGIGVLNALQTQVSNLAAAGGARGVFVANTGGLTIAGVGSVSGVAASNGGIDVSATGDLVVNAPVDGGAGATTLTGGAGSTGNNITLNAIVAGSAASVFGGGGPDTIAVNVTGSTPLLVDGKGSGDRYVVAQSAVNAGGLTIQDSGSSGVDILTSSSSNVGPENINVTPLLVARSGSGTIAYSGIETLNVSGSTGSTGSAPALVGDLFTIALSNSTIYNLDGLTPSAPNNPGDKIFYDAAGASVNDTGTALKQSGKQDVNYANIETVDIANNFLPVTSLAVAGFPSTITAGTSGSFTVTLRDLFGHVAKDYTGTIYFSSSDSQAALPSQYTFTAPDAGRHTFAATFKTAGSGQILIAGDTVATTLFGTQNNITVKPGAPRTLTLGIAASAAAGDFLPVTITAQDGFGNAANFLGAVHFTSSDANAALPPDYTFTPTDAGSHRFTLMLATAGAQTVTIADTAGALTSASGSVNINPGRASTVLISGLPATLTAGTSASIGVQLRDAFGNLATGYLGALRFTSSDAQAVLPADYAFTSGDAGQHSFTVTFKTAGTQALTLRDTFDATLTGGGSVAVSSAAASRITLTLTGPNSDDLFDAALTAFDRFNNVAAGYTGTIHFTSTDPAAILPGDYSFTAADAGQHTFVQGIGLFTPGNQTVTATDVANGTLTATSAPVNIPVPPPILGSGGTFNTLDTVPLNSVVVGTFTQGDNSAAAGKYSATILWGDGATSNGVVAAIVGGYQVTATHPYVEEGMFTMTVTVTRNKVTGNWTGSTTVKEGLPDGTRGTANQLFVSELYSDLLGRRADDGGLAFWTGFLDRGGARAATISVFQTSIEYRKVEVNAAYHTILHRDADAAGKSFFAGFLQGGGAVEQLEAVLAGSDEYFQQHAGSTNDGYLDALYGDVLHRPADSAGKAFFDGLLQARTLNRTQVASIIIGSAEFFRTAVNGYYQTFLGRAADTGGLNFFTGILQKGLIRDELLVAFLCATDEYFTRL
jgi:fibronectin-binding autotransporter adhesin